MASSQTVRAIGTLHRTMRALFVLAFLLAAAGPARAEINVADSIEWQTADSDVVVRGVLTSAVPHRDAGGAIWYDGTFQIVTSLKGGAKKSIHVGLRTREKPDEWVAHQTDLLLFLVAPARVSDKALAAMPYVLRPNRGTGEAAFRLGTSVAYLASFGTATAPADVLAAVRASARSPATAAQRLDVPHDSAAGRALYAGSAVWMFVPVDAALEQRAIGWLADPSLNRRVEAVEALGHFKTADNIARVRRLLADPEAATQIDDQGSTKVYLAREAAHRVLTGWGVAHPTPTLREPTVKP